MCRSLLLLPLLPLLSGCADLFSFSLTEPIPEQRVMGAGGAGPLGSLLGSNVPIEVDLASEQSARSLGPLGAVRVSAVSFSVTGTGQDGAGDVDNFDFLNSVQVFVSSGRAGTTLPRVLVAESDPVPEGVTALSLGLTNNNIKGQIEEGAVIEATANGTVPPDDVTFEGSLRLTIEVL